MSSSTSFATGLANKHTQGGKHLTFALGHEEFAIPILAVREIIGFIEVTAVPRTPSHVRGVINLRGRVISVIDLRGRFGMASVEATEQTCIIVIETEQAGRKLLTGIVVDRVGEVLNIADEAIEAPPVLGSGSDAAFITGMAKVGQSIKIVIDIDQVLVDAAELSTLASDASDPARVAA